MSAAGTGGAVTLGELVGRVDHLEVRCRNSPLTNSGPADSLPS